MLRLGRKNRFLLSIVSGAFLVLSFPEIGDLPFLAFFSFIPLLFIEKEILDNNYRSSNLFIHSYITFFLYNIGTTWWIWNASHGGAIFAFILNALIMATTFQLFHFTKKRIGKFEGYISLILFWIAFEYIHYQWELSWPWLNLGNIFANSVKIIQWYSITGVLGGTFWVLILNLLGFFILCKLFIQKKKINQLYFSLGTFLAVLIFPILVSIYLYNNSADEGVTTDIIVSQPNVDPYNEKFIGSIENQLDKICDLVDKKASHETDFVLAPETALPFTFYEDEVDRIIYFHYLVERKAVWENASLVIGASTKRFFKYKKSRASRKLYDGPGFEEYYNSSMLVDFHNKPSFVHKSKLVLGVEKIPFSNIFPWLEELSINNGGASGTLGIEEYAQVMRSHKMTFAPVVCYESVYGNYIAEQCRKGAQLIFIITNDGWWGNTPGHRQHFAFSRLRAIENRKSIARSANTGISGFINQRGDIIKKSKYWQEDVLGQKLKRNNIKTFYTNNGDFIGRSFGIGALILLLISLANLFKSILYKSKL
jgi:apolipoprotein N-acyltransferase